MKQFVAIALFFATPVVAQERDKVLHAEAGFVIAAMCDSVELNPVTCGLIAGLAPSPRDVLQTLMENHRYD